MNRLSYHVVASILFAISFIACNENKSNQDNNPMEADLFVWTVQEDENDSSLKIERLFLNETKLVEIKVKKGNIEAFEMYDHRNEQAYGHYGIEDGYEIDNIYFDSTIAWFFGLDYLTKRKDSMTLCFWKPYRKGNPYSIVTYIDDRMLDTLIVKDFPAIEYGFPVSNEFSNLYIQILKEEEGQMIPKGNKQFLFSFNKDGRNGNVR